MTYSSSNPSFNEVLSSEFGFRLDSSYILNYIIYKKIINILERSGANIVKLSELVNLRRESINGKTATILIKSLWKASIHPLRIEVRDHGNRFKSKELDIIGVATGLGSIGKFSILPKYLSEIIEQRSLATTSDLIILEPNEKRMAYYIVTLLNTRIGKVISDMLTYGSTGQLHLDAKWLEDIKIPVIKNYENIIKTMEDAIENCEAKAWRAYFKAMKIVEEQFGKTERLITNIIKAKDMLNIPHFRLDSSRLLAFSAISRLVKEHSGKICKILDLFEVYTAGVPREKKYKSGEGQHKLITIDSIDESGIIDDEKIYYITREGKPYPKGSILLVKDGASIGKVTILPYDAYVMQGIAVLIPKPNIDEKLKYYVMALLKSSFYKKIIEALGYGATVQYSVTKDELESIEIPIIEGIIDEISRYMREFVESMYQANYLKKQAVVELDNYF